MLDRGYLYIAYGDSHIEEAQRSVASLRAVDKNAHVTLITDRQVEGFDSIIKRKRFRKVFSGKVDNLSNEYYEKTLFVDTDTYFCEDCSGLFELLGFFDLCAVLDPAEVDVELPGLTSYNTGVLLYKRNSRITELLNKFRSYYNDAEIAEKVLKDHPAKRQYTDQPFFTRAIRDTDLKIHSLPDVWNARYRFNIHLMGTVKIIHGPTTDFSKLQKDMNYTKGNRIWKGLR